MTTETTEVNPFEDMSYAEIQAQLSLPFVDEIMLPQELVQRFHEEFNCTVNQWPPTPPELKLRHRLIEEEFIELSDEFKTPYINVDKQKVAKELADILYVVYGTAVSFGIDLDRVFQAVHESNMSKTLDNKREDGKVRKGENYRPPDLSFVV